MSWHILPSGTKLFCVLSMELLGVENPVFSSPFHQGGGRAAKQPALPTLSLFHPAKTGRLEFLRTVVPTTGEGPVGSLDPAHWAKGCSSAQALLMSRPLGRDRSLENQVLQVIPEHPLRAGCLLHLNIGASGSCQQGTSFLLCSVSRYVKTNTPTVHRGTVGTGSSEKIPETCSLALCSDLAGLPGNSEHFGGFSNKSSSSSGLSCLPHQHQTTHVYQPTDK